ncbi:MAG TPA: crossover junction endodeoxyribonuclease RuvC [Nitrospiraceae bacterium]|nr:crossover junction endodeoxyribonuclease RuvC [Nitrospiraceae bacterium]
MSSARWWRRYFLRRQEKDRSRIILGIDPGSIVCGYGIIKTVQSPESIPRHIGINSNTDTVYIASGRIMLPSKHLLNVRLRELYSNLADIIREYSPHEVAVEKVFFAKSIKAALVLGQARGAALVAAASSGLPVYEYSALEVKKAIVGYGRAEKHQVQSMVSKILNLKTKLSADSADALALALCHLNTMKILK